MLTMLASNLAPRVIIASRVTKNAKFESTVFPKITFSPRRGTACFAARDYELAFQFEVLERQRERERTDRPTRVTLFPNKFVEMSPLSSGSVQLKVLLFFAEES